MEHWHRAYNSLNQDYLALKDRDACSSCQRVKDEGEEEERSTGRETRQSLELKLDKVYKDLRYWQECYETLLSEQRDRKKFKKTHTGWNSFFVFPIYYKEGKKKFFFFVYE